jgi:hypothetical protein
MLGMSTPTVIEAPITLEPVTSDPFVADLDDRSPDGESRLTALRERYAAAPRRLIFD